MEAHLMTQLTNTLASPASQPAPQARPLASLRFDWLIALLSAWMICGIHLDAWAHHQFEVETFFTPWHGVLYSGFLALAAVLAGTFVINIRKGRTWRQAMPIGYELSLLGVAVFMAGGIGDMIWHIVFGIEVNVEALLSPTHLMLALGGAFIVTGPIRAAWARVGRGWNIFLPALLSLALLLSVLSFFTSYANPLSDAALAQGSRPTTEDELFLTQGVGVAGILIQAALMMGVILVAVRRWERDGQLPFGSLTVVLALSSLLTISVHEEWRLLPLAVFSGLAADLLLYWLKPSTARPTAFRWFAFAVPTIFYTLYIATLALTGGIWWTIHLWAGAIVLAGVVGWLLSYAFVPPSLAE
jgi:hypothetical protein